MNLLMLGVRNGERTLNFDQQRLGWQSSSASQDGMMFIRFNKGKLTGYLREKFARNLREFARDTTVKIAG